MTELNDLDTRLRTLERRLLITQGATVMLVALLAVLWTVRSNDLRSLRRSSFTNSLTIPGLFSGAPLLNAATDGSATCLTISNLADNSQVRLEHSLEGASHLLFFDRRGRPRLRLGLNSSGEPYMETLDTKGGVSWSPSPLKP